MPARRTLEISANIATSSAGRRRDRGCLGAGALGGAVAVAGEQSAKERSRALPGLRASSVTWHAAPPARPYGIFVRLQQLVAEKIPQHSLHP